jgi:hypothetical protein
MPSLELPPFLFLHFSRVLAPKLVTGMGGCSSRVKGATMMELEKYVYPWILILPRLSTKAHKLDLPGLQSPRRPGL